MAIFRYLTKDFQGNYHKGEMESADLNHAAALLRRKKLIIVSLKPRQSQTVLFGGFLGGVPFKDIVVVTRQLATMVEAGLTLSEALDLLIEEQFNKKLKETLQEISTSVKGGMEFGQALEKYGGIFPRLYVSLVKAGEVSGKLDKILLQLATHLEKEREFNSKIKGAMMYPALVIMMMGAVMGVMIFFVMPKLANLYKESSIELPLPTQITMGIANFLVAFWWLLIFLVALGITLFRRWLATPRGKVIFDTRILSFPVVGQIVNLVALTNFTRTFSLLISAGIPILGGIKIVADVVGNAAYKIALDRVYLGVERGLSFSSQLKTQPVFPKIVSQMAKTGEETGKLDEVLSRLSDYFESESNIVLKNLTTMIEPIILIILGVAVGFLVLSIIMPIYQLTSNIK